MDRISALRNVEEALAEFEAGDCDLATMERRVRGVLRTYATEFALAACVETHDPIAEARDAVEKRDLLAETMTDVGDLR